MANANSDELIWSLNGSAAALKCGTLSGHIEITRPNEGLQAALGEQKHAATLLGVRRAANVVRGAQSHLWPLTLGDSYVRAGDLVASYEATRDWPFSPQLYWRAGALRQVDGVKASLSLLISFQTHLLDTCPEIEVGSRLPASEALLLTVRNHDLPHVKEIKQSETFPNSGQTYCTLTRLSNLPLSYIELATAEDFREIAVRNENDNVALRWQLFNEFLEKGVIRRARVHAAILPRENDIAIASACCKAADRLELPLTT